MGLALQARQTQALGRTLRTQPTELQNLQLYLCTGESQ